MDKKNNYRSLDLTMFLKIFCLLIFFPLAALSQANPFSQWRIYNTYIGDLNGDKKVDKIIIYQKKCDSTFSQTNEDGYCKRVAIFLNHHQRFVLYGFNDYVIDCTTCGGGGAGDPFRSLTILPLSFSIHSLYGDCDKSSQVTTFKFDPKTKDFYLYKIVTDDYNCKVNENGQLKTSGKIETKKHFGKIKFMHYQ